MANLKLKIERTFWERWFTFPWHPFTYVKEEMFQAELPPRHVQHVQAAARAYKERRAPPLVGSRRRSSPAANDWIQTEFSPRTWPTALDSADPSPFKSGGGGNFDGGGASGRWESSAPSSSSSSDSSSSSSSSDSSSSSSSSDSSSSSSSSD